MRPSSQRRWSKVTGLTQVLPSASAIPSRCRTRDALGPMLMPGTDLAERTRLLIDLHVKSSPQQRRSHSKAANAATYDCDRGPTCDGHTACLRATVLRPFPFTIGGLRVLGHGLPTISRVGTNYCASASFRGSLTASKVANSMAQGSPFTFSTLRI